MIRPASLALLAGLALAPAAAIAAPSQPVAAQHVQVSAPTSATPDDSAGYAQRESHSQAAQKFNGGDLVVVTISGGALVVLFLLLILLA